MAGFFSALFSRIFSSEKETEGILSGRFLRNVACDGALAKACVRLKKHNCKGLEPLPNMSTWSLICEEIVDTTYEQRYYDRVVCELHRRNLTDDQIKEMRIFAWRTAGWLNFEKNLLDWNGLGEKDILMAIDWQAKDGLISQTERESLINYLNQFN